MQQIFNMLEFLQIHLLVSTNRCICVKVTVYYLPDYQLISRANFLLYCCSLYTPGDRMKDYLFRGKLAELRQRCI